MTQQSPLVVPQTQTKMLYSDKSITEWAEYCNSPGLPFWFSIDALLKFIISGEKYPVLTHTIEERDLRRAQALNDVITFACSCTSVDVDHIWDKWFEHYAESDDLAEPDPWHMANQAALWCKDTNASPAHVQASLAEYLESQIDDDQPSVESALEYVSSMNVIRKVGDLNDFTISTSGANFEPLVAFVDSLINKPSIQFVLKGQWINRLQKSARTKALVSLMRFVGRVYNAAPETDKPRLLRIFSSRPDTIHPKLMLGLLDWVFPGDAQGDHIDTLFVGHFDYGYITMSEPIKEILSAVGASLAYHSDGGTSCEAWAPDSSEHDPRHVVADAIDYIDTTESVKQAMVWFVYGSAVSVCYEDQSRTASIATILNDLEIAQLNMPNHEFKISRSAHPWRIYGPWAMVVDVITRNGDDADLLLLAKSFSRWGFKSEYTYRPRYEIVEAAADKTNIQNLWNFVQVCGLLCDVDYDIWMIALNQLRLMHDPEHKEQLISAGLLLRQAMPWRSMGVSSPDKDRSLEAINGAFGDLILDCGFNELPRLSNEEFLDMQTAIIPNRKVP